MAMCSLFNSFFLVGKHPRGFEPMTYHKEFPNSAPIHHESKAPWASLFNS